MTAINHGLTGAVVGLVLSNPFIAISVALLSHFICDALPHFGFDSIASRNKLFRTVLFVDALLALILATILILQLHWLALACAFVAIIPDTMWLPRFIKEHLGSTETPITNPVMKFHKNIQWSETPKGIFIELFYLLVVCCMLAIVI